MSELVDLSPPSPEGLRTLRLNRPDKANALSAELVECLHASLDAIGAETRALLIRGEGRHFCAGFLTIAWVSGAAFGAGADIACSCAVRIGTPAARFRFPGFQFGVALGTRRLATIAGAERARQILLHNEELDVHAALHCGLLTERSEEAEPQARIEALMHSTRKLDAASLHALFKLTDAGSAELDLAELVCSVARPGLHARIAAYRQA